MSLDGIIILSLSSIYFVASLWIMNALELDGLFISESTVPSGFSCHMESKDIQNTRILYVEIYIGGIIHR